jgi:lycopene beta-cyclase
MSTESIAVVGGGLAGLSLALQLQSRPAFRGRLTIYEARDAYRDDRRWSFWPLAAHPFSARPLRHYPQLRMSAGGRTVLFDCAETPYACFAAGDLYADARARLAGDARFELRMGTAASAIDIDGNGAVVRSGAGDTRYDRVFDARPPQTGPEFLQWFVGGEIEVPAGAAMPAPVLMDFDLDRRDGDDRDDRIVFAYVLPQHGNTVLVQLTYFLPRGAPPPTDAWSRWRRYVVERLWLDPAGLRREECGAIPMDPSRRRVDAASRVQPLGAAAGWIRAATGYGFVDTQRACARLAEALVHAPHTAARVRPRARIDDAMDAVLLEAMRRHPQHVGGWFLRLFERCPPPRLIRFLSGEATAADRLAVMAALPTAPFAVAALRRGLRGGARGGE